MEQRNAKESEEGENEEGNSHCVHYSMALI
jgi:hypothetical protein